MISLEAPTASGIQLGECSKLGEKKKKKKKTDWGKKRLRVDTLYPQSEGFLLLYIFGILRVSLLTFGFSINSTILVLWNLTGLSAKFQRTFQESEI